MIPADDTPMQPFAVGIRMSVFNFTMRNRRREMGLTQMQLAELAGVSIAFVQRLELLGTSRSDTVPWDDVERIADTLDLSVDSICPRWLRAKVIREIIKGETAIPLTPAMVASDDPDIISDVMREELAKKLATAMSVLSPRQRQVIEWRFGLTTGGVPVTLKEVAYRMGLESPERVRQIEAQAIKHLQKPAVKRDLKLYLDEVEGEE